MICPGFAKATPGATVVSKLSQLSVIPGRASWREPGMTKSIARHPSRRAFRAPWDADAGCAALLDHPVGDDEKPLGHVDTQRFCRLEIDEQVELGRLSNGRSAVEAPSSSRFNSRATP